MYIAPPNNIHLIKLPMFHAELMLANSSIVAGKQNFAIVKTQAAIAKTFKAMLILFLVSGFNSRFTFAFFFCYLNN